MAQPSSKVKVAMMIDIETLDTARTAVVIQVAAVTFEYDLHGYYKELNSFNIPLRVGPQVDGGRTISASTIDWWLGEDKYKVFSQIICDGYDRPGDDCLLELKGELSFSNCDEYWFQGPTFDAIILEDLLGEGVVPWKYHQVRDQRTVDNLAW
ncbi:MAG: 3'-5' exoribonuclease, partial [Emcibacter sp.]|nr:3'-5' exoribonuclease [Emcibacter sp.]